MAGTSATPVPDTSRRRRCTEMKPTAVPTGRETAGSRISTESASSAGPPVGGGVAGERCGRLADVLATVSFFYGHRDPVSVTTG